MNVLPIKAKIMSIRLGLDLALERNNVDHIILITDSIQGAKAFFNTLIHPYQTLTLPISKRISSFFKKSPKNHINIWYCPSKLKWKPHNDADNDVKISHTTPILPSKESWAYSRKTECDGTLKYWEMSFQASDRKGKNFLEITDNKGKTLKPSYKKGGSWLSYFGYSNSTCARITRLITNHASTREYHQRFFPQEEILCNCGLNLLETRDHILYECKKYNEAWRPPDLSIFSILIFLKGNPSAFCFDDS